MLIKLMDIYISFKFDVLSAILQYLYMNMKGVSA